MRLIFIIMGAWLMVMFSDNTSLIINDADYSIWFKLFTGGFVGYLVGKLFKEPL